MSDSDNALSVWVKGKITNLVVMADDWSNPTPKGKGVIFIYMNELPPTSQNYNRVVVSSDHPSYNMVLEFALTAKMKDAVIALRYIESNVVRSNSWDFAQIAFDIAN